MIDVEMRLTPGEIQSIKEAHVGVKVETIMIHTENEIIVRISASSQKKIKDAQYHMAHLKCLRNALEGAVPKEGV